MTTNPVSSAPMPMSATANKEKTTATDPNSSLGQDAFLKLLVAQLKYQDPLNPADGADFMAQTAQFTMVEKLAAMQKQGETTISSQKQLQAIQLVGKQVSYTDATGMLKEGVVQSARFTPDGQTLMINGTNVNLSSVTGVTATSTESSLATSLANLGPSLSESLSAAIREALASSADGATSTKVPSVTETDTDASTDTPVDSTDTDSAVAPDASTESTSTDGAAASDPSSSDGTSESSTPAVSDPVSGEG